MRAEIVAVRPGAPTMVDVVIADVRLSGEWVGLVPLRGVVDVELDVDAVFGEGEGEGVRLPGTVDLQDGSIVVVRIADGLVQVEVNDAVDLRPGAAVVVVARRVRLFPTGT